MRSYVLSSLGFAVLLVTGCGRPISPAVVATATPSLSATETPAQAQVLADIRTLSGFCTESIQTLAQETLWAQQQAVAQGVARPDVDFIVSDVTHMAQQSPAGRQDCLPWFREYVSLAKVLNPPAH